MNYLQDFFERNKNKSFFTNLMHYNTLSDFGKQKCISSFLTHLIIDIESGLPIDNYNENKNIQLEVLSLLNNFILAGTDEFIGWLRIKLED